MKQPFDLARLRASGFKLGFVDEARRAATPHLVHCHGLNEDQLGQQSYCQELRARLSWIRMHCVGDQEIEPIRDPYGRLTGRLYRFSEPDEAFWFKLCYG